METQSLAAIAAASQVIDDALDVEARETARRMRAIAAVLLELNDGLTQLANLLDPELDEPPQ